MFNRKVAHKDICIKNDLDKQYHTGPIGSEK